MVYLSLMTAPSKNDDRAERLAAALRENLKRRKAQARAKQGAKTEAQPAKSPSK
jgi:hypothetical protein